MRLIGRKQSPRLDAERCRHAGAIFQDFAGVVLRADTAIEARVESTRDAARSREKAMADSGQCQRRSLDFHDLFSKAGNGPSFGAAIAIALNNSPMPRAPPAINRENASSISEAFCSDTADFSTAARSSMPRRRNKSRCRIGPWMRAPMV